MTKKRIAVFASGSGTNAEKIFEYFQGHSKVEVALLLSNKKDAFVLQRAAKYNISTIVFGRSDFYDSANVQETLLKERIDFIVLAGFMWLVPESIISTFENRIVNIHPALLPKYGGKGMYGAHVHNAVKEAGESKTGITIHWVNKHYDEGDVIQQFSCELQPSDDVSQIAKKVQILEHKHYPEVIENVVLK